MSHKMKQILTHVQDMFNMRQTSIKHEVELFIIENFVLVFNTRELNRVPTTIFYTTSIGLYSDTSILK